MPIQGVPVVQFVRELAGKTRDDNVFNGAAALGFYLTLAIFPAMVLTMSVIPFLPIAHVDQAIMDALRQALPRQAADMFTQVVEQVMQQQSGGLVSLGAVATVWATSTGMYAIMQQLNITYGVREARGFVRARAVAIALSLLFCGLIVIAFSLIVLGGTAQSWLGQRLGFSHALLAFFAALRWVIIVLALMLAFSLTYYLAPNVRDQKFRFVTAGAVCATLLLLASSIGFAIYVQNFADYSAVYGGIGAVIALMLWLYIAGLAMLVGSEIDVLLQHHAQGDRAAGPQAGRQPVLRKAGRGNG